MSSSESEESRGTSVSVATVAETTPAGPSTLSSPPRAVDKAAAPVADAATGSTGGSVHARSKRRKPVYDPEIPGLPGEGGWMARKVDESENPWPIYATVMKYVGITKVCVTDSRQTKHAFVCLLCQKTDTEEERVFKCDRTSAGNIRRHMAAHKDDPDWLAVADRPSRAIKAAQEAAAAASECEGSTPVDKRKWKQITIQDTFLGPKRKKSASDVTQAMWYAAIAKFFERSLIPFDNVSSDAFLELMKVAQPNRTVLSRTTMMRRFGSRYDVTKKALIEYLKGIDYVATTTDLWTAHNR